MLNMSNIVQSSGKENKPARTMSQPVKIHELLGIPKSTVGILNNSSVKKPRMQPVRIKDLFSSTKKESRKFSERRMTTVPSASKKFSINAGIESPLTFGCIDNTFIGKQSTAGTKLYKTHLSGISKSDGKIHKTRDTDCSERGLMTVKRWVEPWEKCQTVKPTVDSYKRPEVRSQNVRRKLYDASSESNRKSVVPNKSNSQKETVDSEPVKSQIEGSSRNKKGKPSRKSLLVPPNFIKTKYVKTCLENVTITEKLVDEEDDSIKDDLLDEEDQSKDDSRLEDTNEIRAKKEMEKNSSANIRPTVIMGIGAKAIRNIQHFDSKEGVKPKITRIPLQELSLCTSPHFEPDIVTQPLDNDNGNFSESCTPKSKRNSENLPPVSKSACNDLLMNANTQVLSSFCKEVNTVVQSMEQQLASMKQQLASMKLIQKIVNDFMDNSDNEKKIEPEANLGSNLSIIIENSNGDIESSQKIESYRCGDVENIDDSNKENMDKCGKLVEPPLKSVEKSSGSPSISSEDSFSQLETQLNIEVKSRDKFIVRQYPKSPKRVGLDSRHSIREYMTLKSAMSFLATPNAKGFVSPRGEKDTPRERRSFMRSLSRKVLSELDDLYANTP